MNGWTSKSLVAMSLCGLAAWATGCEEHFTNAGADAGDATGDVLPLFYGTGVGGTCAADSECRSGLICKEKACAPSGARPADDSCILSEECAEGLQCGFFGFCVASQDRLEGDPCTSVSDCARGLFCDLKGVSGFCAKISASAGDLQASCSTTADCLAGLHCSATKGTCQPGSLPLSTDLFPGVACPEVQEANLPFQARVVVPRQTDPASQDFYRTPFPNDVWRKDNKVSLTRHPRPGPGLIGLDVAGAIVDALDAEMDGFSNAPTIYVRFTRPLDKTSIVPSGPAQNVYLVDLDSGALIDFTFEFHAARNKYICANWFTVHPRWSKMLKPYHTFGLVILDSVRAVNQAGADPKEAIPVQGDDLAALLGASKPADATLGAAWDSYAKLRAWLASKNLPAVKVTAVTSFTTTDPTRVMKKFRAAVEADPTAPSIVDKSIFVCGGANKGKPSPCIDPAWAFKNPGKPDPRDCPASADTAPFTEVHMKIRLPVWQAGARPYLSGGGGIELDGNGTPKLQGHEDVCASLIVPKNKTMPAGGWPLIFFGHGTGGSLRSGPSDLGAAVADLSNNGTKLAVAMLSLDQPMHGDRRGLPLDPGPLFYNFANPPAAKGNVYQGAADNFALVRFARTLNVTLPAPINKFQVNGAKLAYVGHSQGGTTGPIWLPWAHDGKGKADALGAVFSGTGGSLVFSLLNKKSPEDATVGIKLALQEGDLDEWHPVLSLMQHYFDEADPFSYGQLYHQTPVGPPVHLLHTFGQGDTYTPPQTSRVFAASTGGTLLKPKDAGDWFDAINDLGMKLQQHTGDVAGNITVADKQITGVTVEHRNDADQSILGLPYDGHFVAFRDKVCNNQVRTFLGSLFDGKVPRVPAQ